MKKLLITFASMLSLFAVCLAINKPRCCSINLLKAYEIASAEAFKWDVSAKPYFITSVDDPIESTSVKGNDGTRNYWNFDFVIENADKHLIITVHNKTVVSKIEAESVVNPDYIISMEELRISTEDAVTISIKNYGLLPGIDWAQGYHFVLENDGSMLVLSVVGVDETGSMNRIHFNAKNGEVISWFDSRFNPRNSLALQIVQHN